MKRNAAYLTFAIILTKLLGLARGLVLSYFYGSGVVSDVYFTSWSIPTALFGFIVVGIVTTFIPLYVKAKEQEGPSSAESYMQTTLTLILILSLIFVALGLVFTRQIVIVFAHGFSPEKIELTIRFTRITLFSAFFIGVRSIYESYHEIKGHFLIAPVGGFIMNFFMIGAIFLSVKEDILLLPLGIVLGSFFQYVYVKIKAHRDGYHHTFRLDLSSPSLKAMVHMSIPIIIGASVDQINMIVDRTIASRFADGSISAIAYASQLNDAVTGIFVVTLATVLYPTLVTHAVHNNHERLKYTLNHTLTLINLLIIPAMVVIMVLSVPIVTVVFGKGQFDDRAIAMTASLLYYYSIGLIGYGTRHVVTKTFYALHDTKTPVRIGIFSVFLNVILNLILSYRYGVKGLAMATSIAALTGAALLYNTLRLHLNGLASKELVRNFIKTLTAALIMGWTVHQTFRVGEASFTPKIGLFISIIVGVLVYAICLYILNIPVFRDILELVSRKIGNKQNTNHQK